MQLDRGWKVIAEIEKPNASACAYVCNLQGFCRWKLDAGVKKVLLRPFPSMMLQIQSLLLISVRGVEQGSRERSLLLSGSQLLKDILRQQP